ncbi:MAG TPA: hypothetical protein VIJ50_09630 [Solirubrobacteraceae bacterium]
MLDFDNDFDVIIIHRDAESAAGSSRVTEIQDGVTDAGVSWPVIPVVPIRMTEAWLLLDEQEIREVAGRPSGSQPLGLPAQAGIERLVDPKAALGAALDRASGFSGRRLAKFKRDFSEHRRQLLDRLDRNGPIKGLAAWSRLEKDVEQAMSLLLSHPE